MPTLAALALSLQNCDSDSAACKGASVLHWLYIAAAVLAVVLVLVVVLAVQIWRKNRDADPND